MDCGVSEQAVIAFINGDHELLEQELERHKIGEFLIAYKTHTGKSFIKTLMEIIKSIENVRDGSIGELLRLTLMAFGVQIDDIRFINVLSCLREWNGKLYIDARCKNSVLEKIGPDGKKMIRWFGIYSIISEFY